MLATRFVADSNLVRAFKPGPLGQKASLPRRSLIAWHVLCAGLERNIALKSGPLFPHRIEQVLCVLTMTVLGLEGPIGQTILVLLRGYIALVLHENCGAVLSLTVDEELLGVYDGLYANVDRVGVLGLTLGVLFYHSVR